MITIMLPVYGEWRLLLYPFVSVMIITGPPTHSVGAE